MLCDNTSRAKQNSRCLTSTETIRLIRDGEGRGRIGMEGGMGGETGMEGGGEEEVWGGGVWGGEIRPQ